MPTSPGLQVVTGGVLVTLLAPELGAGAAAGSCD